MAPAPSVGAVQAEVALHQQDTLLYSLFADEIWDCTNLWDPVKEYARNLRAGGATPMLVMPPIPELLDDGSGTGRSAADIWALLPKHFDWDPASLAQARAKGDRIWSYNALVQDAYSPKWTLDFAPINFRIQPGFVSQSLDLKGIFYWRLDLWMGDAWNDLTGFGVNTPADGTFVYPGSAVGIAGVAPGMRLKWLREGLEDYEYIRILKQLGRGNSALSVAGEVGPDWVNWTRDTNQLYDARKRLGDEIDAISRSTPDASSGGHRGRCGLLGLEPLPLFLLLARRDRGPIRAT